MTIHHLKINREPFDDLASGAKTSEVRDCYDRHFKVGDRVSLTEYENGKPTGRHVYRRITHIQRSYGLPDHMVVLSYAPQPPSALPIAWLKEDGSDVWTSAKKEEAMQSAGAPGKTLAEQFNVPLYEHSQPPAGGEQEVLAWLVRDTRDGQYSAHRHNPTGWAHGYQIRELIDRAAYTAVAADRDSLRYKAELYDEVWKLATGMGFMNVTTALDFLTRDRDALKARVAELDSNIKAAADSWQVGADDVTIAQHNREAYRQQAERFLSLLGEQVKP